MPTTVDKRTESAAEQARRYLHDMEAVTSKLTREAASTFKNLDVCPPVAHSRDQWDSDPGTCLSSGYRVVGVHNGLILYRWVLDEATNTKRVVGYSRLKRVSDD